MRVLALVCAVFALLALTDAYTIGGCSPCPSGGCNPHCINMFRPGCNFCGTSAYGGLHQTYGQNLGSDLSYGSTLPISSGINYASSFPASSGINYASTFPASSGINYASTFPASSGINYASTFPASSGMSYGSSFPTSSGMTLGSGMTPGMPMNMGSHLSSGLIGASSMSGMSDVSSGGFAGAYNNPLGSGPLTSGGFNLGSGCGGGGCGGFPGLGSAAYRRR